MIMGCSKAYFIVPYIRLKFELLVMLSRIAVGILVIAPENASCERAFSIMKFIKNNQRSCLSQLHLDNALRIGLEIREPSDFPFEQLFHYIKN